MYKNNFLFWKEFNLRNKIYLFYILFKYLVVHITSHRSMYYHIYQKLKNFPFLIYISFVKISIRFKMQ